ncbi:MAG: SDR family NAD(P)-dependent oxidoreductase [Phycisphaerales bacterium]|nr:SDR family NAD(P)-dependent oxidoreductase [Phycisphaerales bacterium]
MSMQGRSCIVTGGGSGIGRAIVQSLSSAGFNCLIVGRREQPLMETASLCESTSGTVVPLVADVSCPDDVGGVIARAMDQHGRLDGIVNNAAGGGLMPFPSWTMSQLTDLWKTNVLGPAALVLEAWPHLLESGGRIVNISSMAVLGPFPGNGAYGMTKAALDGMTRAIDVDASDSGVEAYSIAPGAVETEMLRSLVDDSQLPPAKAMSPAEIAQVTRDCLEGARSSDAGKVLYAPIPGFVTTDPEEAMVALGRFHSS